MAIGAIAASISVIVFKFLAPKLSEKIELHDSCGVHNLHGIPGVLGGISSAIIIACYNLGYY
jgi:ammonium transporter Rh